MQYVERLKEARKSAGLTQQTVAKHLGIPSTQVVRYEKGINEIPVRYLCEMCKLYGVSADWVLGISKERGNL